MRSHNKENYGSPSAQFLENFDNRPNRCEMHKSTQELQIGKNKNWHCIDQHRLSDALPFCQKTAKLEAQISLHPKRDLDRQALANLRNSENFHAISTIDMLKKQVELLDLQENLGTLQKFSTLQYHDFVPQKNILLQVTKFRKQNIRKVAKGRPELYNWVKNHKQDIANMQYDYKTQVMKKYSKPDLKQNINRIQKMQRIDRPDRQKQARNHESCRKSKRISFVEKLKKIQELKQRGQSQQLAHKRRVHSQNEEFRYELCTIKTLV